MHIKSIGITLASIVFLSVIVEAFFNHLIPPNYLVTYKTTISILFISQITCTYFWLKSIKINSLLPIILILIGLLYNLVDYFSPLIFFNPEKEYTHLESFLVTSIPSILFELILLIGNINLGIVLIKSKAKGFQKIGTSFIITVSLIFCIPYTIITKLPLVTQSISSLVYLLLLLVFFYSGPLSKND